MMLQMKGVPKRWSRQNTAAVGEPDIDNEVAWPEFPDTLNNVNYSHVFNIFNHDSNNNNKPATEDADTSRLSPDEFLASH
jgi:hypothetical protein